mgnify:CR=1 FL=1
MTDLRHLTTERLRLDRPSRDDLAELFGVELDDSEVETVGGLLALELGRGVLVERDRPQLARPAHRRRGSALRQISRQRTRRRRTHCRRRHRAI